MKEPLKNYLELSEKDIAFVKENSIPYHPDIVNDYNRFQKADFYDSNSILEREMPFLDKNKTELSFLNQPQIKIGQDLLEFVIENNLEEKLIKLTRILPLFFNASYIELDLFRIDDENEVNLSIAVYGNLNIAEFRKRRSDFFNYLKKKDLKEFYDICGVFLRSKKRNAWLAISEYCSVSYG